MKKYSCERKMKKVRALRASGFHKEVKALSDVWTKRIDTNVRGFYDPKKAKV